MGFAPQPPCADLRCELGACVRLYIGWGNVRDVCLQHARQAADLAQSAGKSFYCAPLYPLPPQTCDGCGSRGERCNPSLWARSRKCCPDCNHSSPLIAGPFTCEP